MFQGRKVVITGASPDFGEALSILFAKMGAELFLSARTLCKAQATSDYVKKTVPSAKVSSFKVDVSKHEDIIKFSDDVKHLTSEIDILIHNASFWLEKNFMESCDEEIIESINSTATGTILMTKHFLPLLEKSSYPDIVFINSTASLVNSTEGTLNEAFSAAKGAQSIFADRLRKKIREKGIRCITVYPPNFDSLSPLDETFNQSGLNALTTKNVFESIQFALSHDRVCSVDKIVLSNNTPIY